MKTIRSKSYSMHKQAKLHLFKHIMNKIRQAQQSNVPNKKIVAILAAAGVVGAGLLVQRAMNASYNTSKDGISEFMNTLKGIDKDVDDAMDQYKTDEELLHNTDQLMKDLDVSKVDIEKLNKDMDDTIKMLNDANRPPANSMPNQPPRRR